MEKEKAWLTGIKKKFPNIFFHGCLLYEKIIKDRYFR